MSAFSISGSTRVVAILGDPVAHSLSPAMHNAAFRELGLDLVYVALRVRPEELRVAVRGIRALGVAGLNVTVPHKEAMVRLVDELTDTARAIGAVNTVFREGDRLVGDNTDAPGFLAALREIGVGARGTTALVIGAGGSARAVVHALASGGARRLVLVNRTVRKTASLASLAKGVGPPTIERGSLALASDRGVLASVSLVVNTTPIGLEGRDQPPIDLAALSPGTAVVDLAYSKDETPLVRAARARGLTAADGRGMLLHQAALAFRLWTGEKAPLALMRDALGDPPPR